MQTRNDSLELLKKYVKSQSLLNHCKMVAQAMESYAKKLSLDELQVEEWFTAGLLHDLDWEMFPDEHPNKAVNELLIDYPKTVNEAIKAHSPDRTGKNPESLMDKYLFACDEICGFINAVSLVRPTGFDGMEVKSVLKRLKEPRFAANVSREDIYQGVELIGQSIEDHISFLLACFTGWTKD